MELNKIYNEDCLQTMQQMPDNYVDFIITSPPYDDIRNYNGYNFEFEKIANEIKRVLKIGGIMIWVVGDKTENGSETGTSFKQALYFKEIGLNIHDTMIYYKNNPMPTAGNRYHQHFEYMFAITKGSPKTFNPIKEETKYKGIANMKNRGENGNLDYKKVERTNDKKIGNVFSYSIGGGISTKDKIAYQHPAIFPEQLVSDQVLTWTNEFDIIYDPFMGSGTTAKIALLHNRQWLGSEISKVYVDIAEQRLKENFSNKLFTNGFS